MVKKLINTKFKKDILFSYFTQVIVIIFGFINIYIITNYAGIEKFGQLSILVSTVGFMSLLLTARSGEAIVKFYKREKINHNYQNAKAYLFYGVVLDIITAILLFGLTWALSSFIATSFLKDTTLADVVTTFAFINVFFFLRGTMSGYLQANEMFYIFNGLKIIDVSVLALVLYLTLTSVGSELINIVDSYIYTKIIIFTLTFIIFVIHYVKEFRGIKVQLKKEFLKEYLKFNIITFSSSSLKAGNQNFDSLVLSYFASPTIVGVYAIIKKFFMPIQVMVSPFSTITYPKLTKLWYEKKYKEFDNTIKKIVKLLFLGTILYFILLSLFSDLLISIFKLEYEDINILLYLMMGVFIFTPLLWWTRSFSNIVNPNYSLYAGMYYTIFQIMLLPLAVSYGGIINLLVVLNLLVFGLFLYWFKKYKKDLDYYAFKN